ncbi:putative ubiquitin-conjugating enzyme E2 7 [Cucumispora dikerogammari]|nr:putative ubiquitin-conjugating enzyme E2 7 [Cucumispora dikerogammari]
MVKALKPLSIRRLVSEEKAMNKELNQQNFLCFPRTVTGDLAYKYWDIFIFGFNNTLYEGCVFLCEIEIPPNYSMEPPKMKFVTRILHPNVYLDGRVCISILHTAQDDPTQYTPANLLWSPVHTISSIIISVTSILTEPNTDSPANIDASKKMLTNFKEFEKEARSIALRETPKATRALSDYKIDNSLSKREKIDDYLNYDLNKLDY